MPARSYRVRGEHLTLLISSSRAHHKIAMLSCQAEEKGSKTKAAPSPFADRGGRDLAPSHLLREPFMWGGSTIIVILLLIDILMATAAAMQVILVAGSSPTMLVSLGPLGGANGSRSSEGSTAWFRVSAGPGRRLAEEEDEEARDESLGLLAMGLASFISGMTAQTSSSSKSSSYSHPSAMSKAS
ncbi:hypothetical protein MUK42_36423 [Musa troglodytarum]|uniref:Uncharacterized protein n=1 Tax=Musa troglodytarum TaxID=320322 RepID=A0A9E7FFP6_9LILI|nr:hypothetical protein MUK42_36423 [Musa troglodytarum]